MAFKVFLSYSLDPAEQALAWRLQTLAAAHGIEMYVPPRGPGVPPQAVAASVVQNAIDRSDCVLAILTAKASPEVQKELRYAFGKGKVVIPIVHSDFAQSPLLAQFPSQQVFKFSPWANPGKVETDVIQFLKGQNLSKENRQKAGGLVALGIGLLLLFSLTEKK